MTAQPSQPDVSLMLEHETATLVDHARVLTVLDELGSQVRAAPFSTEVLVPLAAEVPDGALGEVTVRRFPVADGAHYYEVKNAGARASAAPIIVFADSDVLPADGWFHEMVRPFADPAVDAVVGGTAVRPVATVADKAFAAGTWWPARHDEARGEILANSFAVRREVFLPDGFPGIGCRYRGADTDLRQQWRQHGVHLTVAAGAHSDHPPPPHLVRRAVWDGHDQQIRARAAGRPFVPSLARVVLHQLVVGSMRIVRHRQDVQLTIRQLPLALAANAREAMLRGVGFALARVWHGLAHRVPR